MRHACRILVVDDDVLIRAQLCAVLHAAGYEVETASSGEDALRLLRAFPCDIVVTDWQMPTMDGAALCRQVRAIEQQPYVYIVMLTVKHSPQDLLAGFAAGADDYVVKGTSNAELLARVENGRRIAQWQANNRSTDDDVANSSLIDSATGAYNLAYFIKHLPREWARSERYGHELSVLSCAFDGIAPASDRSAATATESMRDFVARSTSSIRQADWLARMGKSELMVVLPETGRQGAQYVARKLSGAVKIHVTAIAPADSGDGSARIQALLRKAEVSRQCGEDERRQSDANSIFYLSDLVSPEDTGGGRNWPAT